MKIGNGGNGNFQFRSSGGRDPFDIFNEFFGGNGNFNFNFGSQGGGFPNQFQQQQQQSHQHRQQQQQQQVSDLYTSSSPIKSLSSKKFPDEKSKYIWFVQFYSPSCSHCQQFVKSFEKIATEIKDIVKFGAINCLKENEFCSKHNIQSLPTFKLIINGEIINYEKELNQKTIYNFIKDNLPMKQIININKIKSLTNLIDSNKNKKSFISLLLTDKFETSSLYKSISNQYRNSKIIFTESKAKNNIVSSHFDVTTYPSLLIICNLDMNNIIKYNDEFEMKSLSNFYDNIEKECKKNKK